MLITDLARQNLIHPPRWLPTNTQYLGYAGSASYGVSSDTSDMDCFGFAIPPKEVVFPYSVGGEIVGFSTPSERFRVWTEHHIKTVDNQKEYDFSVYNIVDFFKLCMDNNPNMLDVLFLPRRCILHSTHIGEHVRDNRKLFLHKGSFHKLREYAYSQLSKIENKTNSSNPKRAADIKKYGFDTKFSYHVIRLALQSEQILAEHDLDIERNSDILKSVRRGEWTLEQIKDWFANKEKSLETLYANSTLQHKPDEEKIKHLLLECLEAHYGSLESAVIRVPQIDQVLNDLAAIIDRYGKK